MVMPSEQIPPRPSGPKLCDKCKRVVAKHLVGKLEAFAKFGEKISGPMLESSQIRAEEVEILLRDFVPKE